MRYLLLFIASWSCLVAAETLENQRQDYRRAEELIDLRRFTDYRALRARLQSYPLAIYLDYRYLDARLSRVGGEEAAGFIGASEHTPLSLRFKDRYLRSNGKRRQWGNFLAASPTVPNDVTLQCYYYRAVNQRRSKEEAWRGARQLWLHGQSRPRACDPLFAEWIKAGQLTDDIIWQRQLLAFDARRRGLMTYAAGKGSDSLAPWSERLLKAYLRPDLVHRQSLPVDQPKSLDIYVKALKRRARRDAAHALQLYEAARREYPFSAQQALEIETAIARRGLMQTDSAPLAWIDGFLARSRQGELLEMRLRRAIKQSDWRAVLTLSDYLPDDQAGASAWRFWRGYALRALGDDAAAREAWLALAGERDYYGFLAAEMTGREYELNHAPVRAAPPQALRERDGTLRTRELMFHGETAWAQSEWSYLLTRSTTEERTLLARYALDKGWHRFAIDAANAAGAWDAIELRFPRAFESEFTAYGEKYAVPETELMAIARRESAFAPGAVSGAGARGLMQLLPGTARAVSRGLEDFRPVRDLSQQLFDVETNIALGGAYYRQLLDQYQNNRVLTLAAYNAGPYRVKRWLNSADDGLSAPQWIETIPYRETREYVQGVLAYNVVYQAMGSAGASLFTRAELDRRY